MTCKYSISNCTATHLVYMVGIVYEIISECLGWYKCFTQTIAAFRKDCVGLARYKVVLSPCKTSSNFCPCEKTTARFHTVIKVKI